MISKSFDMIGYRRKHYRSRKDVCHDTCSSGTECVVAHLRWVIDFKILEFRKIALAASAGESSSGGLEPKILPQRHRGYFSFCPSAGGDGQKKPVLSVIRALLNKTKILLMLQH